MHIQPIILIITSLMLVIISAWNLSIFIRLKKALNQYTSDDVFDTACHISKHYVITGENISIIMLIISILLMIFSSVSIYKNNS